MTLWKNAFNNDSESWRQVEIRIVVRVSINITVDKILERLHSNLYSFAFHHCFIALLIGAAVSIPLVYLVLKRWFAERQICIELLSIHRNYRDIITESQSICNSFHYDLRRENQVWINPQTTRSMTGLMWHFVGFCSHYFHCLLYYYAVLFSRICFSPLTRTAQVIF